MFFSQNFFVKKTLALKAYFRASVFFTKHFCEKKACHKVDIYSIFFHKSVFQEIISYNIEYTISDIFFTKYTCLLFRYFELHGEGGKKDRQCDLYYRLVVDENKYKLILSD